MDAILHKMNFVVKNLELTISMMEEMNTATSGGKGFAEWKNVKCYDEKGNHIKCGMNLEEDTHRNIHIKKKKAGWKSCLFR